MIIKINQIMILNILIIFFIQNQITIQKIQLQH